MLNYTALRPSVLSRPDLFGPHRKLARGIRLKTIVAGLIVTVAIFASLTSVAVAETAPTSEKGPVGLFFQSDLTMDIFAAPTLSSDVVIDISGEIARVNIRQRFRNPSEVWLEGVYVFPLPERAAVDRLTLRIGAREFEGEIFEKKEAERVYREAADAGRQASLLSSARPNVFSTRVANIGPGEEIVIEIEYQDRIRFDDGAYSYRFPLVVTPRYTPETTPDLVVVPPAPREDKWPEMEKIKFGVGRSNQPKNSPRDIFGPVLNTEDGSINLLSLAVLLDAGFGFSEIGAPNHDITITRDGETRAIVTLEAGSVPAAQDFVLNWTPVSNSMPMAGLFTETVDGSTHLVTTVLPPQKIDPTISMIPRDIVLILDKSGSMHGTAITQAKQAIRLAISRLPKDARFNLIAFDNAASSVFNSLQPANEKFITRAFEALDRLEANGGTEMREALDLALGSPRQSGRLMQVVFLTDGAVSNERELLDLINRRLGDARLFTVGIGPAPNGFFMRRAAEAGRGTFTYIDDPRELDDRISSLLRKLERPALTDLSLTWDLPGADVPESYPVRIPDLYYGEPITFATKLAGTNVASLSGTLKIKGRRGQEDWTMDLDPAALRTAKGVAAVWARSKIADLEAQQGQTEAERDRARDQMVETALTYQLVTQFTSLVAVDDTEVARPQGAPLAQTEIKRNLPVGMSMDKVFGTKAFGKGGMTPVQDSMFQNIAFRQAVGLPVTATPATQMAISGGLAIALALLLLILRRYRIGRRAA